MCKSPDRQGTLSGPSQLVLLIPPLRLIKKLVKKTSPHVVRTWSKDTKANTSISNGFRSGHKSWDGTISWVWWSMIPLHWQHTLSLARSHYPWNSAHASNQTAFGDIRENPMGYVFFAVISLHLMHERKSGKRMSLGSATLPDILWLFFFPSDLNTVHLIWQLFLLTQITWFFFGVFLLCKCKRIDVLAYWANITWAIRPMLEAHSLTFCVLLC